jgi:hypothetical protein
MSSGYDRSGPSKALEDAARVKVSSNLDQLHHILLLHRLANAYLSLTARMLFAKFLDKHADELERKRRAA